MTRSKCVETETNLNVVRRLYLLINRTILRHIFKQNDDFPVKAQFIV
jgi:hypothetical protein